METGAERYKPLYLKHRPQALAELVGQAAAARTLENALNSGRISHAYLFTGPRGTGKTSSARILAKSLNCESGPTPTPCQKCTPCVEIQTGNSPGVFEIDAASNNSVDDARVLIERAPLVAVSGRYKLYIIDECHMLTKEAFNALLKTIEEPPPNVIFVLATTEEHKVPPTIISRCQRLMFRLVNQKDLLAHLSSVADKEGIEIEKPALELVARRSGGGLRDALGLLDQASLLGRPGQPITVNDLLGLMGAVHEDVLLDLSEQILEKRGDQVLAAANRLLLEGREPSVLVLELARHFLSLAKASYMESGKVEPAEAASIISGSEKYVTGLLAQAPRFERGELSQIVEQLDRLEQTLRRTTQPAMHFEIGLLSICHRHDIRLVSELSARVERLEEALAQGGGLNASSSAQPAQRMAPAASKPATPLPAQPQKPASEPAANLERAAAPEPLAAPTQEAPGPAARQSASLADLSNDAFAQAAAEKVKHEPVEQTQVSVTASGEADQRLQGQPFDSREEAQQITLASDQEDQADLDLFWSQLLDQLQKVNIPAYSVLSEHAFPLGLTEKECTIGVLSEHFQTTVERRLEKIKTACEAVVGRAMSMKVKIASGPAVKPARNQPVPQSQARPRSLAPAMQGSSQGEDESSSSGGSNSGDEDPLPAQRALPPEARFNGSGGLPPAVDTAAVRGEVGPKVVSGKAVSSHLNDHTAGFDARTVRDAYKIFEGPGSRLIV
jgi:DNA polymerase-3 subunit gamma/tau